MLSIGVVARQTGIVIGTLRKWELRYGFPLPRRSDSGQRYFNENDVQTLLAIARRIAAGERVGQIIRELDRGQIGVQLSAQFLAQLPAQLPAQLAGQASDTVGEGFSALQGNRVAQLISILEAARGQRSVLDFVEQVAAPLTFQVGEAWARGELQVYVEHLFSSVLERLLSRESRFKQDFCDPPDVLLATPAGERHTLGLAMVKAVLSDAGVASLRLPGDLPVPEIVAASTAYRVKAVGLSASSHYPPRLLGALVGQLRESLPPDVELWLGGAGMNRLCQIPPGATLMLSMGQLLDRCKAISLGAEGQAQLRKVQYEENEIN